MLYSFQTPVYGEEDSGSITNDGEESVVVYTKEEFVDIFVSKADILDSLRFKIESAEIEHQKVLSQYFPRLRFMFGIGPHPKYEYEAMSLERDGDGEYSIIHDRWKKSYWDFSEYGVAIRTRGEFMMPIFTSGKIMRGRQAAQANIRVKTAEKEIGELNIRKEAALFYWSWVMANDMISVMKPALAKIDEAEEKLEEMLYNEKEGISQKDLIKLRIEKEKLAYQYKRLLLQVDTLKAVIDAVLGDSWSFADTYLEKVEYDNTLEDIVDHMFFKSPQSKYLKSGIEAYKSLYRLEIARILPDFGIAGNFAIRYTSSVHDADYPYANSPYNSTTGEVGIGFTFNLNFLEQARNIQQARAELNSIQARARFIERTVPLEVKKMYNELKALRYQIKHIGNARRYSRGWMTAEMANYGSGFNNTDDLIDSVKAFFENEYLYIKSIFDYNIKVEEIIEFTGAK